MIFLKKGSSPNKQSDQFVDHKVLESYLNFLAVGYKSFGLTEMQKVKLLSKKSIASMSQEEKEDLRIFTSHRKHYVNHGLDSIYNCGSAIRELRKERKFKSAIYSNKYDGKKVFRKEREYSQGFFNGQTINSKYSYITKMFAQKWWDEHQSRTNVKIQCNALAREITVVPSEIKRSDSYSYYNCHNDINISPSWFRNVYMKGLATTTYKSKTAFVANAKPFPIDRIKSSGLDVYKIDLITCHDGVINLEKDLWYLVYESKPFEIQEVHNDWGGNVPNRGNDSDRENFKNNLVYNPAVTINCASDNFRRAENVMNGRVQKNLLNAMGV